MSSSGLSRSPAKGLHTARGGRRRPEVMLVLSAACAAITSSRVLATGLDIHTTFDSSVTSLPNSAQIQSAFNYAAQQYSSLFSNSMRLNITVKASPGTGIFGQSDF